MASAYTGPELKALRRRAMLTQRDVVRMTGVCEQTIIYMERGVTNPHMATLSKVLTLYGEKIAEVEKRFKKLYGETQVRRAPQDEMAKATVSTADESIAKNCKYWRDGQCDVCGVPWQGFEVDSGFHCAYFTERVPDAPKDAA